MATQQLNLDIPHLDRLMIGDVEITLAMANRITFKELATIHLIQPR